MLKRQLESLDDLPEAHRELYTEAEDGTFQLDAEGEDVSGLKSALRKERDARRQADRELRDYQRNRNGRATADVEELEGKLEAAATERDRYRTRLTDALMESAARTAIRDHNGSVELLLPHLREKIEVREVDGRFKTVILGDDGEPRLAPDATKPDEHMSVGEYVATLRDAEGFARAFGGRGATGSGVSSTADTGGGTVPTIPKGDDVAYLANLDAIAAGKVRVE